MKKNNQKGEKKLNMDSSLTDKVISCFDKDSIEYKRLQSFMYEFNAHSPSVKLSIKTVLFDANTNKSWTTLIAYDPDNNTSNVMDYWQILCPKTQATVIFGTDNQRYALRNELITKYIHR